MVTLMDAIADTRRVLLAASGSWLYALLLVLGLY
jgi:hypothetical protein